MSEKRTRKACPGCSATYLRDNLLCANCLGYLRAGQAQEKRNNERAAQLGDDGKIAISVPLEWPAYLAFPYQVDWDSSKDTREQLGNAVRDLLLGILPVPEVLPTKPYGYGGDSWSKMRTIAQANAVPSDHRSDRSINYRLGTEEQRKLIIAFWEAVVDAMKHAHQAGIDHGRNLLTQLAAGEITLDQLNSATSQRR